MHMRLIEAVTVCIRLQYVLSSPSAAVHVFNSLGNYFHPHLLQIESARRRNPRSLYIAGILYVSPVVSNLGMESPFQGANLCETCLAGMQGFIEVFYV